MRSDAERAKLQRFETQILVHLNELYRTALRLTGRSSDAQDLVQETCLRAFELLDQLRHVGAAKVWLFSILRSVFLRQAERAASRPALVSLDDIDAALLTANEALQDWYENFLPIRRTLRAEVREAVLKLPPPYREAVVLAHIGGFSYREMAEMLSLPIGTVMSRLFRGRRMLRACLREVRAGSETAP